jgi:hypothetical protein
VSTPRAGVAVDWSGAADERTQRARIRIAVAVDGVLVSLEGGLTRDEVVPRLLALADAHGTLAIGLDFAVGVPAWYARDRLDAHDAPAVWAALAERCEALLRCEAPFWGRPGVPRWPELADPARAFRRTELALDAVHGIRPKSVFQVGGAGAVGTGTLRGMPALRALRAAGVAVWPWDAPGAVTAAELYPRLATGALVKSSQAARESLVATHAARIPRALRAPVAASEDALDAGFAALALQASVDTGWPPPPDDADARLEGWIVPMRAVGTS